MSYAKLRPRRGTTREWSMVNPVLEEGEMGIEYLDETNRTGPCNFKMGDGKRDWKSLPYAHKVKSNNAVSIYGGTVSMHHDIFLRSGSTEDWLSSDPVLGLGEIVYDISVNALKIGNGNSRFSELDYILKKGE